VTRCEVLVSLSPSLVGYIVDAGAQSKDASGAACDAAASSYSRPAEEALNVARPCVAMVVRAGVCAGRTPFSSLTRRDGETVLRTQDLAATLSNSLGSPLGLARARTPVGAQKVRRPGPFFRRPGPSAVLAGASWRLLRVQRRQQQAKVRWLPRAPEQPVQRNNFRRPPGPKLLTARSPATAGLVAAGRRSRHCALVARRCVARAGGR
jgi:hypothetical protein